MIQQFVLQSGGADRESESLKNQILNAPDKSISTGSVYYVSNRGSDSADGRSPATALCSVDAVRELPLNEGDSVLFERGSVFRLGEMLWLKPGVHYGAYGAGKKPLFVGSLRDYADSSVWRKSADEDLWIADIKGEQRASMIVLNGGEAFANWCYTKDDISEDGDFFHDNKSGLLYLRLSLGNPGSVFKSIEIATTGVAMRASFIDGMTVQNIEFKYFTQGAFLFGECNRITISDCVMGWQGGKIFEIRNGTPIRYGNAAEFWYQCRDITVENCYVYQIYDAALTFQGFGDGGPIFSNITFKNNLIEYCSMNIEYWAGNAGDKVPPHIENISYTGNIIRFCGYGFGGIQREDKEDQALLLGWNRKYTDITNFVISDNILDCSNGFYIFMFGPGEQSGIILSGNSYYQKKPCCEHGFTDIIRGKNTKASNGEEFKKAIALFDQSPKAVGWLS